MLLHCLSHCLRLAALTVTTSPSVSLLHRLSHCLRLAVLTVLIVTTSLSVSLVSLCSLCSPGSGSGQLNATSYSNAGITWSEGALPANVSKFGLGNTTVLMASGLNYYWTETWKVGNYSLENRTLEFTDTEPEFPGDHSGRTVFLYPR